MTARILVVDDIPANRKLLETRLGAEYYNVVTAEDGFQALEICAREQCDLILLDVMMPGMDGFQVCEKLKSNPDTSHIPVVMVTALDQIADRVRGLEAGADDFLTKPVNDLALMARVKSLVRLKMLSDELRLRAKTSQLMELSQTLHYGSMENEERGKVVLVTDEVRSSEQISRILEMEHDVRVIHDPKKAVLSVNEQDCELVIIALDERNYDPLRLCSQLRSQESSRMVSILLMGDEHQRELVLKGLELGINDYVVRPIDRLELLARSRSQIRRKRYTDRLRNVIEQTMELAVTDSLTRLYNRHYLETHLGNLVSEAEQQGRLLSLLILDLDHFKMINDCHGHDAGDDVLREFARRLQMNVRGVDLCCRFGGEEFVILMPDTDIGTARDIARRICDTVAGKSFGIAEGTKNIAVTVSIGAAQYALGDNMAEFLKRADEALYRAKDEGRNRVVSIAA